MNSLISLTIFTPASIGNLGFMFTVMSTLTGLGQLKVFHVKPGSIVVPGLAGPLILTIFLLRCLLIIVDAHAHVLEYGFNSQLKLDGATSIQGKFLLTAFIRVD
jgi:hypothetical protein